MITQEGGVRIDLKVHVTLDSVDCRLHGVERVSGECNRHAIYEVTNPLRESEADLEVGGIVEIVQ